MDEVTKGFLNEGREVASELYKDAVQPVIRPIGVVLGFLPRTIRRWLSSWEKWLINGEASVRLTAEVIEDKIKKVPVEKLVEPAAYVAIPAIQQLTYCQDNPFLRELYANLLVSSMISDTQWKVHPSYVDIIKQLNPDEAKLLRQLKIKTAYPLIDIRLEAPEVGYNDIVSNYTAVGYSVIEQKKDVSAYIDNLNRLGIIRISDSYLIEDSRYNETIEMSNLLFSIPETTTDGWKRRYNKRLFELTDFGASFVIVVVNPEV